MDADSKKRIERTAQNELMKSQQAADQVIEEEHIPNICSKSASMRIDIPVHQRLYDHAVQLQLEKKRLHVCINYNLDDV